MYNKGPEAWDAYQISHEFYLKQTSTKSDGKYPIVYFNSVDPKNDEHWDTMTVQEWDPF